MLLFACGGENKMIRFIMSVILGVLPDVLYYFMYIKNIKGIKERKFLLFLLLFISYILLNLVVKHNFYLY